MRNFPCKTAFALAVSMLVCGCGTTNKLKFEHFTEEYKQGEFCKATDTVLDEKNVCNTDIEKFKPADFNIDEQLNAGTSLFLAQKHELSESLFEKASSSIQEDLSSTGIARGTVEVVANASMLDYNPMIMDGIYLHSYTFLNALSAENKDDAKIQINRAYNFQQNAVNAFSKEIEKETKNEEEKKPKKKPMLKKKLLKWKKMPKRLTIKTFPMLWPTTSNLPSGKVIPTL